ncbi:hypothetical protein KBC99_03450, partial [Candidatus Saccharibacteria bacterium]|nr:hypothetical protein [Candidatus Saccharibacteria bacterium]
MRISSDTLKNLLLSTGKASPEIVSQIEKTATQTGESLDQVALRSHIIGERELVALYAKSINLPYVDLTNIKISRELLARIPERIAKKYQAILFGQKDNKWQLATADPEDIQAIDVIEKQLGGTVQLYVATTGDILSVLDQYRTGLDREISAAIRESSTSAKAEQSDTVSAEDISEDAPIAKTV